MQSLWQELLGRAAMKPDTWGTDEAPFVPSMEAFKSRMLRPLSDELGTGPPRITSIPQELRPLLWQFTLGLLPCGQSSGELVTVLAANRRRYTDLCTRYLVDPSKQNRPQQQPDWNLMNPLSQDEQSPWNQFFKDSELRRMIEQDVERTFPDYDFFRRPAIQRLLTDILFVYCRDNEELSYRQGMHELLAPIVYVQFHHSTRKSLSASQHAAAANGGVELSPDALQLFQAIGDPQFAAHDSFTLFERLMVRVKQWYSTDKPSTTASSSSRISTASTDPWNEDPFRPLFNRHKQPQPPAVEDGEKSAVPVVRKCWRLQNRLLRFIDAQLWQHLRSMEIEPQVYGIRWFRLLFGREFELPDLLVVWDTIFLLDNEDDNGNFGGENQFTDWLGLALLLAYRDQLLTADYSGTLHLLMKHRHDQPPVERIQSALSLRERYPSIELAAKPPLEADLNSTTADSSLLVRNAQRTSAVSLSPRRSPSSTAAVSNVVGGGAKDFLGDLKRTIMEPVLGPLGLASSSSSNAAGTAKASVAAAAAAKSQSKEPNNPPVRSQASKQSITTTAIALSNRLRMELDVLRSTLATVKLLHQTVVEDGGGLEAMTTTTQSSPNLTASTAALFARTMQSNSLAPSSGSSPFYSDDISAVLNPFESSPIVAVGLPQVPPTSWSALRRKLVGGLGDVEDQLSGCLERITFIEKDIVEESQSSIDPNNVVKPEIIQKEPVQPTKSTLTTRLSMPAVKQPQRSSPSIIVQNEGINPGDGKDQSKSLRKKLEDLLS